MLFKEFTEVANGFIFIKGPGIDGMVKYDLENLEVYDNREIEKIETNGNNDYIVTLEDTKYDIKLKQLRNVLGLNNGYGHKENFNVWIYDPKDGKQYAFDYRAIYRLGERFVDKIKISTDSWGDAYSEVILKEEY